MLALGLDWGEGCSIFWAEAQPLLHLNGSGSNVLVQIGASLNPTRKGNPSPSGVEISLSLQHFFGLELDAWRKGPASLTEFEWQINHTRSNMFFRTS